MYLDVFLHVGWCHICCWFGNPRRNHSRLRLHWRSSPHGNRGIRCVRRIQYLNMWDQSHLLFSGGIINVMPFLYTKIEPVREQVLFFRRSVTAGLLTCTVLNVLWYFLYCSSKLPWMNVNVRICSGAGQCWTLCRRRQTAVTTTFTETSVYISE